MRIPFDGNFPITQRFGEKITDPAGHKGIDYALYLGTPVLAALDGKLPGSRIWQRDTVPMSCWSMTAVCRRSTPTFPPSASASVRPCGRDRSWAGAEIRETRPERIFISRSAGSVRRSTRKPCCFRRIRRTPAAGGSVCRSCMSARDRGSNIRSWTV